MPIAAIRFDFLAAERGLIIAGGIAVILLAIALYGRERRIVSPAAGRILLTLRVLLAAVLFAGLLKPVLVRTRAQSIPPRLIVLEDISRSMDVAEESFPDERLLRIASALGELPDGISASGIDSVCRDLPRHGEALTALAARAREVRGRARPGIVPADPILEIRDAIAGLVGRIGTVDRSVLPDSIERMRVAIDSIAKDATGRLDRLAAGEAKLAAQVAVDLSRVAQEVTLLAQRARGLADSVDRETAAVHRERLDPVFARIRGLSRRALAEKLLLAESSPLAARTGLAPEVQLFARDVRSGADPDPKKGSRDRTDIANALQAAAEKAGGEGTTTIVLASDGNANAGGDPVLVAEGIGRQGIAIHTLAVGSRDAPRDAAVLGVETSPIVFADDRLAVSVRVKADGMAGENVKVRILEKDKVVEEKEVRVDAANFRQTVSFALDPGPPGVRHLAAQVAPARPDRFPENERRTFTARVVNDRIRVLLADGTPRWEYRFLRNLLVRETEIEFTWALADPLQGAELGQDRASSGYPRSQEDVHSFDCIILGDVAPSFLGEEGMEHLASFVQERGGTLIVIAGREHMPEEYFDTPLARLIPVAAQPRPAPPGPFAVVPTAVGSYWTMLHLSEEPAESNQLWGRLLPQMWISPFRHAERKTVEVIAAFAAARGKEGGAAEPKEPKVDPGEDRTRAAVVAQSFGLGQVLYFAFDGTWRWRYKIGDALHHRFWGQVLRWATADRLPAGNAFVKLGTDKPRYEHGERVTVRARLRSVEGRPLLDAMVSAEIELVADPRGEPLEPAARERTSLRLRPSIEGSGFYDGVIGRLEPGRYQVKLSVPALAREAEGVAYEFEIAEEESVELSELGVDERLLERIAGAGGGRAFLPEEVGDVAARIATTRREQVIRSELSLWDDWPLLALAAAIVTIEWLLRKRAGLV